MDCPTGGTKKIADAIAAGFGTPVVEMDQTKADVTITLGEKDALTAVLPVLAAACCRFLWSISDCLVSVFQVFRHKWGISNAGKSPGTGFEAISQPRFSIVLFLIDSARQER